MTGGVISLRVPPGAPRGPPAKLILGGARYTSLPWESNPGVPNGPPMRTPASLARGVDITRAILPLGSITSIDSDAGSTNSVESPRYAIRPPARAPYAFPVALVVSATTVKLLSAESNNSTRRPMMSLTSSRPSERGLIVETAPSFSLVTVAAGAICRTGGSCCASAEDCATTNRPTANIADFVMLDSIEVVLLANDDCFPAATA